MHTVTHALVLREVDYKESDKILTVLTAENGKMTLSARGCRKKNSPLAASCQLLVWSEMTLYEYQGRWSIKEASAERRFEGVRNDLDKLSLACYIAEMIQVLAVEELPAPDLLSLTLNSLHALDKLDYPLAQIKAAFELKAMCLAGYEPALEACGMCGAEPEQPRLHLSQGVLYCAACRDAAGEGIAMPLTPGALNAMRHVAYGDPKRLFSFRLDEQSLQRMSDACEAYVLTQLERGFGTLDFYKQLT